jgi:hypothetical protein
MIALALFISCCAALSFTLNDSNERCISIFADRNSYLSGFVKASGLPGSSSGAVTGWIRDDTGFKVWSKSGISEEVRFAFRSAAQPMSYKLCTQAISPFDESGNAQQAHLPIAIDVSQSFEISHDLFDAENARKIKIAPVEEDLQRLQLKIAEIGKMYETIIVGEKNLENSSNWTVSILGYCFYLVSVSLIGIAGWNVLYMMQFFKSKRLID